MHGFAAIHGDNPGEEWNNVRVKVNVEAPLNQFPAGSFMKLAHCQIWNEVMEYLSTQSDITSAYLTCTIFEKYLEEKRNQILLSHVFRILKKKRLLRNKKRRGEMSNPVLNSRLVSKSWRAAIDGVFFKLPFSKPEWYLDDTLPYNQITHQFRSVGEVIRATFALTGRPIGATTCGIIIDVDYGYAIPEPVTLFGEISRFLSLHGDAVLGLRFWGGSDWIPYEDNNTDYEYLCHHVSQMPNLKVLHLNLRDSSPSEIEQRILEKPFPRISSLKYTRFSYSTTGNKHIFSEILKKNPGIRSLIFGGFDGLSENLSRAVGALKLEYFQVGYKTFRVQEFRKLLQHEWRLKVLKLRSNSNTFWEGEKLTSIELFTALKKFRSSLVRLDFDWNVVNMHEEDIIVDFPCLRDCIARGYGGNLKYLHWLKHDSVEENGESTESESSGDESSGESDNENYANLAAVNNNAFDEDWEDNGEQALLALAILILFLRLLFHIRD